eukprot:6804100-Prymnesium_polylepis.4
MKGSIRGHFDLRNVVKISPCNDADAPDAVDIDVAEGDSKGRPAKKLIISFVADKDDRANWLQFWCSAILEQYVHEKLKSFIDLKLAAQYNSLYADQVRRFAKCTQPHFGMLTACACAACLRSQTVSLFEVSQHNYDPVAKKCITASSRSARHTPSTRDGANQ